MEGSILAMVDLRVVTSAKDCLDAEVFSSMGNFISYMGYPSQRRIADTAVMDEKGRLYEGSIVNETLSYSVRQHTSDEISEVVDSIREYLKTQGVDSVRIESADLNQLIEELVILRGMTY